SSFLLQTMMKMPALQDGARGRQDPHRQAHRRQRELCEFFVVISESVEVEEVARQPAHEEDVENEDDDVEQQTTVVFGEDLWGRCHSKTFIRRLRRLRRLRRYAHYADYADYEDTHITQTTRITKIRTLRRLRRLRGLCGTFI